MSQNIDFAIKVCAPSVLLISARWYDNFVLWTILWAAKALASRKYVLPSLEVYHSDQQSGVRILKFSRTSSAVTCSTKESKESKKVYVYKLEKWKVDGII
jgi:hypothetical protein